MIVRSALSVALIATLAGVSASAAFADDNGKRSFATNLTGYQEAPTTISSPGSGEFAAKVSPDQTSIDWVLTYRDLPTNVLQAHIHFGRPATQGGIVLFLCTNLGNGPAGTQACPTDPVGGQFTVTGTLTATDVLPLVNQGIVAGADGFAQIVEALRNGAAYANVHTSQRPGGEIRGALGKPHDHGNGED